MPRPRTRLLPQPEGANRLSPPERAASASVAEVVILESLVSVAIFEAGLGPVILPRRYKSATPCRPIPHPRTGSECFSASPTVRTPARGTRPADTLVPYARDGRAGGTCTPSSLGA